MESDEYTFDKFMDRILLEEGQAKEKPGKDVKEEEKDPRRRLNELYTERPNNRIRFVRK